MDSKEYPCGCVQLLIDSTEGVLHLHVDPATGDKEFRMARLCAVGNDPLSHGFADLYSHLMFEYLRPSLLDHAQRLMEEKGEG